MALVYSVSTADHKLEETADDILVFTSSVTNRSDNSVFTLPEIADITSSVTTSSVSALNVNEVIELVTVSLDKLL